MNTAPYYGWFSQKSVDAGHSTSIYRRDDGQEFEVTSASQDPNAGPAWDDTVALGIVGQFAYRGRHDTSGIKVLREEYEPINDRPLMRLYPEERLIKMIPQKHSLAQIEKILAAADEAGLTPVDDCPDPIIVNMEKTDASDHVG